MTVAMENKTLNQLNEIFNLNYINANEVLEKVSLQRLIELIIDSENDQNQIGTETRQELIKRGKDNIQARIQIKKAYKTAIGNLESILKDIDNGNNNKETIKSFKKRFLNSLSVLDKIQLAWQKYDLSLKN